MEKTTDLESILTAIDKLSPDDQAHVADHLYRLRHQGWIVPRENINKLKEVLRPVHEEAATMTEEEINAAIDEAIAEVRNERKQKQA